MDCHGAGGGWAFNSLIPDLLDPRCDFVVQQEWTEYTEFLEQGCDAALFVGMHAMAGTADGVMNHTVSRHRLAQRLVQRDARRRGRHQRRAVRHVGLPVLLVTGDAPPAARRKALLGDRLTTAAVKQGFGRFSARHVAPLRARAMIEAAAASALSDLAAVRPTTRARRARSASSSPRARTWSAIATTRSSRSRTVGRSSRGPTTGGRPGGSSTSRSSADAGTR